MRYLLVSAGFLVAVAFAQRPAPIGLPHMALGQGPFVFDSAEQHKVRVVVVARGIPHPWGLAFLPGGNMLITERKGNIRIVRDGVLDPQPLAGAPKVFSQNNAGLFDIVLHPKFADNKLVYFTYSKPGPDGQNAITLARGRLEKDGLADVKELYSGEWTKILGGSRIAFDSNGFIFMTTGAATPPLTEKAQDSMSAYGKVLRLKDDGTIPGDNPFAGRSGYRPEIYSLGHRDQLGLAIQPETGAVVSNENGPNGGDEVNLILPGRNYGWPKVSYGRNYNGAPISSSPNAEGIEPPIVVWLPSIAPSGMAFYTGDRFPAWKGNLFVGGMRRGEIPGTGRLERVVFNEKMEELRRESLLTELQQRIRDVRQGPDGFLYVLTEEEDGALLRLEPAQ
jgi:glucose/arabinose dehydrogenase